MTKEKWMLHDGFIDKEAGLIITGRWWDIEDIYDGEGLPLFTYKVPDSLVEQIKEEALDEFKQQVENGSYKSLCSLGLGNLAEEMKSGWMLEGQKDIVKEIEDRLESLFFFRGRFTHGFQCHITNQERTRAIR